MVQVRVTRPVAKEITEIIPAARFETWSDRASRLG
jgi:hypothetical protein